MTTHPRSPQAARDGLREAARDLYNIAVGEHGHDETHSADWPSCLPVHIAMNRYRAALAAATPEQPRDEAEPIHAPSCMGFDATLGPCAVTGWADRRNAALRATPEPLQEPAMPVDLPFPTTDASKWAAEFVRLYPEADEGTMLGWFANAIEHGRGPDRATPEPPDLSALATQLRAALISVPYHANPKLEPGHPFGYPVSGHREYECPVCLALNHADEVLGPFDYEADPRHIAARALAQQPETGEPR